MSGFTYAYETATAHDPEMLRELMRVGLPFVTGERRLEGHRTFLRTEGEGLRIETVPAGDPELIGEIFGFRPTASVLLEQARGDEPGFSEGSLNTVRAVDWLIRNVDGDALLLANFDIPVLLRRDGRIWLDRNEEFWSGRELELLTFPYDWKELPKI